jgi:hypothetical protein
MIFAIRDKVRWDGLPYRERGGVPLVHERSQQLFRRYQLHRWSRTWSVETYREVLGTLDLLDRLPAPLGMQVSAALDVGAKNWRYLGALMSWLETRTNSSNVALTGVEIDAYRLYADLRTRKSYAEYYMETCRSTRFDLKYLASDVRECELACDLIFNFFPFLNEGPHRAWGLPKKLYDPRGFFAHLAGLLPVGGPLILAHQGTWERDEAESHLKGVMTQVFESEITDSLHASPYPIFLTVWTRDA